MARKEGGIDFGDLARRIGARFDGGCAIYLRSDLRHTLVPVAAYHEDGAISARFEEFLGASAGGTSQRILATLQAGGSLLISGTPEQLDAWLGAPYDRHAVRTGLRSVLAVAVRDPTAGVVGAITLGRHGDELFTLGDRKALEQIAASLADRFDRERLAWELRERAEGDTRTARELYLARRRFAAAFEASPFAQALITLGPGPYQLLDFNQRLPALLGTTAEALRRHPSPSDFLHPEDFPRGEAALARVLAGELDMATVEQRALPVAGGERVIEISLSLIRDDAGEPQYGLCQIVDITDKRRDAARLARHVRCQAVLAALGRRALDGDTWEAFAQAAVPQLAEALGADDACVLIRAPECGAAVIAGRTQLGLSVALPAAPVALGARELPREWLALGVRQALVAPIGTDPEPRAWLVVLRHRDPDSAPAELEFVEAAAHLLAAAHERSVAARRATHDPVTGLPNRTLFADRVAHAAERAAREGTALAVVCVDVDRFKDVNDTFGHATGDALIRAIAQRLTGTLRAADTIARIGGDEFGVLCERVGDERGAVAGVRRLLAQLEPPIDVGGRSLPVSASAGVAVVTRVDAAGATVADRLLRDADTAMQRAKERRGTAFELFDPAMRERVVERLRLELDLRRALEEGQFVLHYQPLVSLVHRRVVGVEALVRWRHPTRGMLPPGDFIPVAEETGLVVGLGRWVLEEACRQLARWHADPALAHIYVSVNLSGRQLAVPGLADEIADTLRRTGVAPERLALELTETVLMEETSSPAAIIQSLYDLGVQLLLDDFGTGYSSLNYVKRFRVHGLKVDRSFIAGIPDDESDCAMLRAIVSLAAALDVAVLAEGVETAEQAAWLVHMNVAVAQGFGLARPAPAEAIEPLLRDGLGPASRVFRGSGWV